VTDIRDQLGRASVTDTPPLDLDALHERVRNRRRWRKIALGAVGLVVALVVGGIATGTSDGSPRVQLATEAPEDTTTTTEAPTTTTTTTTPSASSTTSTVPTTQPPAVVPQTEPLTHRPISGTYRGAGLQYEPFPGSCASLAHRLDAVFVLDAGEQWNYRADYCGTVDGAIWAPGTTWTGAGTFMFTTPAGATITGTFTSRAVLPSTGEPYDLTVTGGTGDWTGATGTCHLTNQMRMLPSGLQEQAGTFACDLHVTGG